MLQKMRIYGQTSFLCTECNVWGPWKFRKKHVCKKPKLWQIIVERWFNKKVD